MQKPDGRNDICIIPIKVHEEDEFVWMQLGNCLADWISWFFMASFFTRFSCWAGVLQCRQEYIIGQLFAHFKYAFPRVDTINATYNLTGFCAGFNRTYLDLLGDHFQLWRAATDAKHLQELFWKIRMKLFKYFVLRLTLPMWNKISILTIPSAPSLTKPLNLAFEIMQGLANRSPRTRSIQAHTSYSFLPQQISIKHTTSSIPSHLTASS